MEGELTKRQQQVLEYIREYIRKNHFSPSVRDIAKHFNMVSSAGAFKHLKALELKGKIVSQKNISRSISLVDSTHRKKSRKLPKVTAVDIPLKGRVAAGVPIEYRLENEVIAFPESMVRYPEKTYALEVHGSSMIGEYIQHGDYVLVEESKTANDGEMVVAMLHGEEATLKKFYRERGRIRLQPSNPTMEPIYVGLKDVVIEGRVIGVLRLFNQPMVKGV